MDLQFTDKLKRVNLLTAEVPTVDFRSALHGVVRRWWVVLSCVLIALALSFIQVSGVTSSADSPRYVFRKIFEPVIETDDLGVVQVEPSAIVPVPSFDNQLSILRSPEKLQEIQKRTGLSTSVEVTRSEPKFTIVNTIDQLNNNVSFLATGTPSYTYDCVARSADECEPMIREFVAETQRLRKESVLAGLEGAIKLLDGLIQQEGSGIQSDLVEVQRAQAARLVDLNVKRNALMMARDQVSGRMVLVTENSWPADTNTSSNSASTYGFAASVGLIVGLLVALQLASTDKRIRYAWQITRLRIDLRVLGSPYPRSDEPQKVSLAAALGSREHTSDQISIVFASDPSLVEFAQQILKLRNDSPGVVISAINSASLTALTSSNNRIIVLAKAGVTNRRELVESVGLLRSGGAQLLGVALID
jgi:hypothetical protein